MAQQKVPDSPKLYTTSYKGLRGIDLTRNKIEVDRQHATEMLNMRPDSSDGAPVKRLGWRTIKEFDYEIIGSYHDVFDAFDLVADERNLWFVKNDEFTLLRSFNTSEDDIALFHYDGLVYVIGWGEYFTVDGAGGTPTYSSVTPKVPLTVISRLPDGTGGVDYEGVNILTNERMISFWTKETSSTYRLYPVGGGSHTVTGVTKVEVLGTSGWDARTDYTFDASTQTVTFTGAPPATAVEGQDNVRITFTETPVDSGALRTAFFKSRAALIDDNRLFLVIGNNKIYYSDPENLSFFPDDNYLVTGNDAPIVGLHKRSGLLYSVTGDSSEHSVYAISRNSYAMAKTVINEDWSTDVVEEVFTYYQVAASVAGTGAVAPKTFYPLVDDPLFLGKNGIYGISSNVLTSETIVSTRSTYINPRLKEELNLEKAIATVYDGMYILSVNGHCYVLDSRETYRDLSKHSCYEAYYWDLNLLSEEHATTMLSYDGALYFGTNAAKSYGKKGRWCKFNHDIAGEEVYTDDGEPVVARYALRLDDDNFPQYYKTLQKKGCVLTMKPFGGSSVRVYYSKNGDSWQVIGDYPASKLSWEKVVFIYFDFFSVPVERDKYPRKKVKKYKRLQFMFENTAAEPFGITEFTKTWTVGNFAKG